MSTLSKILIDTDILIDFLRHQEKAQILLQRASQTNDLYCSVVTLAELLAGMRPQEKEATENLISGLILLPVTETIARKAGTLRQQIGHRKILLPDCLIAATALEEKCVLMTGNRKDYPFKGLVLFPD